MEGFKISVLVLSGLVLFLHGLQNFSKELQQVGTEKLKSWMGMLTQNRVLGFVLGAVATSIIQSGSAVTSITVGLVDAGIISFSKSLAVLLGTNVGTTATAWIVTLKSPFLGPIILILGTVISAIPTRISTMGKSIFYFGFIFFSLDLISDSMKPLKDSPHFVDGLNYASNPVLGILYGVVVTAVIQSSSVVTGLIIVFAQQNLITLEAAIPIIMGANIGTTSTALLASVQMSGTAKLTAWANFFFNLGGVIIIYPFMGVLGKMSMALSDSMPIQIAYAHLLFNVFVAVIFMCFIDYFERIITKYVKWV